MTKERELILSELKRVEAMLYKNEQLYDLAAEETDIEALIYEHRALTIRYSALIEKARTAGIREDRLICGK